WATRSSPRGSSSRFSLSLCPSMSAPAASRCLVFFFSSRRRHTSSKRDWSSDVCSSDLHHRTRHPHQPIPAIRHKQLLHCQNQHRRIQPAPAHASRHPPPPLLARPPRPTTQKPHHAALVAERKETTMTNHPLTEQLLNLVNKHQDVVGYPEWESLEPEFDQAIRSAIAASCQDVPDTTLINGQSQNPYEQEPR